MLDDPTVNAVAKAHNKSSAQVALRWIVQQDIVVVTETDKLSHEIGDLELFDWRLTKTEMENLSALV